MGFFTGRDPGNGSARRSEPAIERGGIPDRARDRLRAPGKDGPPFTSGLSVNEFALLRSLGPEPLAQVMGASVVRAGWQYLPPLAPGSRDAIPRRRGGLTNWQYAPPPGQTNAYLMRYTEASVQQLLAYNWRVEVICELDELTSAWNSVRDRALARLSQEAYEVGADAVVGVQLSRCDHNLGLRTIECVVTGTAIRDPGRERDGAEPLLTDLSVQDYWRLRRNGYEPLGLAASTAVVFASAPRERRLARARTFYRNQELTELSGGFQLARGRVRRVLGERVAALRADAVVGVEMEHEVHRDKLELASSLGSPDRRGWHRGRLGIPYHVSGRADAARDGWVITMHGAGTAIACRSRSQPAPEPQIRIGGER
ncbi:MAG TPA: heavy metal-binding domain-containing protein [Solirubrobacteraceae bacterium]|nr:heavy metal-binding domain-containing protein [Solirubrobacteraceae bacterium]